MNGHCLICGSIFIKGDAVVSNDNDYTVHERCNICATCRKVLGQSVYMHKKPDGLIKVICLECGLAAARGAKA